MADELKDFLLYHRAWEAVYGEGQESSTATYRANMQDSCIQRASWLASGNFKETVELFRAAMTYARTHPERP